MERRNAYYRAEFKTRAEGDNDSNLYVEGYFAVFNQETELWPGFSEKIAPGAFDNSLLNNDIRCLFNHNNDVVLGRTGNGTLKLSVDERGLWGSVKINKDDKQAMDIYARVERGDIDGCSFGFYPVEEEFVNNPDGSVISAVIEADTMEVSVVTFPAYPQTEISAAQRSYDASRKETRAQRIRKLKEKMEKKK